VSSSEPFVAKAEPDRDQDVFETRAHGGTNCGFSTQVAGVPCLKEEPSCRIGVEVSEHVFAFRTSQEHRSCRREQSLMRSFIVY
jgi:hypothetical protein